MGLEIFERFVSNAFRNVGQSFYDHYVEANVDFRSRLGMNEVIIRRQLGSCCKWCASLAGIYSPSNAPKDIYKRHKNCRCLVTHKTEGGYQNVWSKKVFQTQRESRIAKIEAIRAVEKSNNQEKYKQIKQNGIEIIPLSKNRILTHTDALYERSMKVPKLDGYDDVFIHGDEYGFSYYDMNGNEIELSVKQVAEILNKYGVFENDRIRLCSCGTGAPNAITAQKLADYMGKEVLAPSKILWTYPEKDGICDMIIADEDEDGNPDLSKPGEWVLFSPLK